MGQYTALRPREGSRAVSGCISRELGEVQNLRRHPHLLDQNLPVDETPGGWRAHGHSETLDWPAFALFGVPHGLRAAGGLVPGGTSGAQAPDGRDHLLGGSHSLLWFSGAVHVGLCTPIVQTAEKKFSSF